MLGIESVHTIPLHQSPQDLAITLILAKASQFFSTKTKPPRNVSLHTHMHTLPCYLHACTHSPAICKHAHTPLLFAKRHKSRSHTNCYCNMRLFI